MGIDSNLTDEQSGKETFIRSSYQGMDPNLSYQAVPDQNNFTLSPSKAMQITLDVFASSISLLMAVWLVILILNGGQIGFIFNLTLVGVLIGALAYYLLKGFMVPKDIIVSGLGFMGLIIVQTIGMGILFLYMIFSSFS